jgi:hypothetical protein
MAFESFDINALSGSSKYLNAKFIKTIPHMATKVRITGGGQREREDRDKPLPNQPGKFATKAELFLTVVSTIGSFEGEMEMGLNKTNLKALIDGLGATPNSWTGKEIGVFFDPKVAYQGQAIGGIKVEVFEANPFAKMAAASPAPQADLQDIPF